MMQKYSVPLDCRFYVEVVSMLKYIFMCCFAFFSPFLNFERKSKSEITRLKLYK